MMNRFAGSSLHHDFSSGASLPEAGLRGASLLAAGIGGGSRKLGNPRSNNNQQAITDMVYQD